MPLDPIVKVLLDALAKMDGPPMESLTPEQAREMYRAGRQNPNPEPVDRVEEITLAGAAGTMRGRLYAPASAALLPGVMYYHGGGWTIGDLDTHDGFCRSIANQAGCAVVAVDYRLAPEHKFPAAADDAYAALIGVHSRAAEFGIDADRLALLGDSAGGNLVAATALRVRDEGGPTLAFQVMVNPVTDHTFTTKSYSDNAEGYFLTAATMRWFWNNYLATETDGRNPYASVLRAESLTGLPPALVMTAEFDPLRDEGDAYADRLSAAGVSVEHHQIPGLTHEFVHMASIVPASKQAVTTIAMSIRTAFATEEG